jgi:hypothetical protein
VVGRWHEGVNAKNGSIALCRVLLCMLHLWKLVMERAWVGCATGVDRTSGA